MKNRYPIHQRLKVPKTAKKPIKVSINVVSGPASPAQKAAWRKFWQKLIAEVKAGER